MCERQNSYKVYVHTKLKSVYKCNTNLLTTNVIHLTKSCFNGYWIGLNLSFETYCTFINVLDSIKGCAKDKSYKVYVRKKNYEA